ncbi:hypothetical protein [Flavobacterium aurantiibacter]|nr:hypothetical protein [Flavobacterium aurantiibacter]
MKRIIFVAFLIVVSAAHAQDNVIKLHNNISVTVSNEPKKSEQDNVQVYFSKNIEKNYNLIIIENNLSDLFTPDVIKEGIKNKQVFKTIEDLFMERMNSKGNKANLLSSEIINFKGENSLKIKLELQKPTKELPNIIDALIFVKGSYSYNFLFVNIQGKANNSESENFFNSITF